MSFNSVFRQFLVHWGFRTGIAVFAGLGVLLYISLNNTIQRNKLVNQTGRVLNQLSQIQVLMEKAEASQRGFVMSNKPIFHKAFVEAVVATPDQVRELLNLLEDNPRQIANGLELKKIIDQRVEKMKAIVNAHQSGESAQKIAEHLEVDIVADVRAKLKELEDVEQTYMEERLVNSNNQAQQTKFLLFFGGIVAAILMFANRQLQMRQAEKELGKTNLLNLIVNSVGDGLVVVDEKNRFSHYNPAAERILGTPKLMGDPQLRPEKYGMYNPATGKLLSPEETPLTRALKGETYDDFEVLIKNQAHPQGVIVSINTRPLRGGQNKIIGAVAVLRDFTERKRAELEMAAQKDKALQASQAKSEALASLSHEIRTPMNGVLGMVTLLLDTSLSAMQRSYALTIKSSAESLLTLINGILDHSKIEAGKLTLDNFDFHLPTLVNDVAEMFRFQAQSKNLELKTEIGAGADEWFNGDGHRIRQILTNLVGNAFKFTEQGSIAIKVSAKPAPNKLDRELRFEIEDTGIGISKENQTKLFKKFSQVHKDKTKYGGTGLGLTLCKQFVQLMNGSIDIESTEGAGSKFWFTVRVAPGMRQQNVKDKDMDYPAHNLVGHILVIEDQPVNRQVVKSFLEKFGITCDIQNNGVEGLGAYTAQPDRYDLVLMDCQMPLMDGFECSEEIRRFEQSQGRPPVPIVALTAEGRQGDRDRCIAAGMDDFLSKPIDITQFYDTLKKWLRPKKQKAVEDSAVNLLVLEKLTGIKAENRPLDVVLVEEFLNTSGTLVESLEQAIKSKDKNLIAEFAHALKSPARTVGAVALGDHCESLEKAEPTQEAADILAQLYQRSRKELKDYMKRRISQAA